MISATPDWVSDWTAVLGLVAVAIVVITGIIGGFVKWTVMPWLSDLIEDKTSALRENNGGRSVPDIADKVDALLSGQRDVVSRLGRVESRQLDDQRALDAHLRDDHGRP